MFSFEKIYYFPLFYFRQITCLIGPEQIYLINIGDSRAIVFSNEGHVLAYTEGRRRKNNTIFERKKIDIGDYYSDYQLITSVLGWIPKTSLEDGLTQTITFYRENIAHYL